MTKQNEENEPKNDVQSDVHGAAPALRGEAEEDPVSAADGGEVISPADHRGRATAPRRARDKERELRKLCIDASPAATRRLINIALDPLTPDPIAIAQCKEILERAYGRRRDLEPLEEAEPAVFDVSDFSFEELVQFEKFFLRAVSGKKKANDD